MAEGFQYSDLRVIGGYFMKAIEGLGGIQGLYALTDNVKL